MLCTGLFDDDAETPDDYRERAGADEGARPDHALRQSRLVVQRGGKLVYCAGALAEAYEKIGGTVIYYGKPHAGDLRSRARGGAPARRRLLAIGDGLHTDIKGANAAGLDALFIADGIHGEDVAEFTQGHLAELFAEAGVHARAAMRALVW